MQNLRQFLVFTILLIMITCQNSQLGKIDLSGDWRFRKDSTDIGIQEKWYQKKLKENIKLPGSMAINGKGNNIGVNTKWTGSIMDSSWFKDKKYAKFRKTGNIKVPFWLQPKKHYIGPAWYQKEIIIPENWGNKYIELFLERCHWETTLWIDAQKIGTQNKLATPHIYDLSKKLTPGQHRLTIRIDNRIKEVNPGKNSHSISDHTQTNWNGIVGQLNLKVKNSVYISNTQVYPDILNKSIDIKIKTNNITNKTINATFIIDATSFNTEKRHNPQKKIIQRQIKPGKNEIKIDYKMGARVLLWDEFHPNLYKLQLKLKTEHGEDEHTVQFGMRKVGVKDRHITINQKPVFLRGTLFCATFPKTGYPNMNEKWWLDLYNKLKKFGLNHMRFHSWCPPEVAFKAADKAGFYLHVESSSWANFGSSIGDGKPIDSWLYKQTGDILEKYGNHPSFIMMAYGNEPAGKNQVKYLNNYVSHWKKRDRRHLYTGASAWPIISENEFHVRTEPRIQQWGQGLKSIINSKKPSTDWNWEKKIAKYDKAVISHEMGQWCVYPDFSEIDQYDGVLKAKNFEIFQETLEENHMGDLSEKFLNASGKLQTICYKADIEGALRTKNLAGFQLLGIHDFSGQGTALVGVLNAFWDEKGYVSAKEFSDFCGPIVPLAQLKKRNYTNNEHLRANIEISNYGPKPLKDANPRWEIVNNKEKVLFSGKLEKKDIVRGKNTFLGSIHRPLESINTAQKLSLIVKVDQYNNSWDFWVYPANKPRITDPNIHIVKQLNENTKKLLNKGEKVLFTPPKGLLKDEFGGDIAIGFSSIFWNTAWTQGQAPHTLGILCDPNHSAFSNFPTEYHSDWQWWDAMSHSNAIIIDSFKPKLEPIVRVIDTWFKNRSLGLIYETKIGKGKLLVSGIDLLSNLESRPEAQQLLYSLKKYMASKDFEPDQKVVIQKIQKMYKN